MIPAMGKEISRTYRGKATHEDPLRTEHGPERAIVVSSSPRADDESDARIAEMIELLRTAGADTIRTVMQQRATPDHRTFLGKGRMEELEAMVGDLKPNLVAIDGELTARQQRVIEDRLKIRVVDRTAVILDIFALHARSAEGKLQVELAQLEYSYQRQEGLWQHLERLGGGVGTRGPGESQLESDRRMLRDRMGLLRRRLKDLGRSRGVMREQRLGSGVPRIAFAGYTNAGKSSLMNALSGAEVSVNDALFETLDPTTRAIEHRGYRLLISDTVGFIRGLPHQLVEAFRSTLDEVMDADLIMHVADASEREHRRVGHAGAVEEVLDEIGAGELPRLLVLNKIDRVDAEGRAALVARHPDALLVSAVSGEGIDALKDRLVDTARARLTAVDVVIPWSSGALVSEVYAAGSEVRQEHVDAGIRVRALMPAAAAARLRSVLDGASAA